MDGALSEEDKRKLVAASMEAKKRSYSPYSKYAVGAALLTTDGTVFTGCNVENSAYPLTTCAERCAVVKAVSEGYRKFTAIAVATDTVNKYASPCGACRQVISEFGLDIVVILCKPDSTYTVTSVRELLPRSFTEEDLREGQQDGTQ